MTLIKKMTPLLAQTLHHIPLCGIFLLFSTNGEEGGGVIPLVKDSTIFFSPSLIERYLNQVSGKYFMS